MDVQSNTGTQEWRTCAKQDAGMRIGRWLRACKSPLCRILTGETAPLPIHLCLIIDEAAFVLLRAATAAHREDARRREARMGALLIPMMVACASITQPRSPRVRRYPIVTPTEQGSQSVPDDERLSSGQASLGVLRLIARERRTWAAIAPSLRAIASCFAAATRRDVTGGGTTSCARI